MERLTVSFVHPRSPLHAQVLASNLDKTLKKNYGVVLDSVSHLDVTYFAPEPEVSDDDTTNSTGAFAANITDTDATADGLPEQEEAAVAEKDATVTRRAAAAAGLSDDSGGKLAINLLVRGHYNTGLKVDFDRIVQDSINRDTRSIRRQLTYYNHNCRDQTTKVVDMGFTLDDFLEIHTNRGVKKPPQRLKRDEIDEQAFSSACNQKRVLPDYFEDSLGGMEILAQTKVSGRTFVVDDGSLVSAWAIVGVIVAVGAFAICLAFFVFRHGLRKKQLKAKEANVTHVIWEGDSSDRTGDRMMTSRVEKRKGQAGSLASSSKGTSRGSKSAPARAGIEHLTPKHTVIGVPANQERRRGILGFVRREINNMTAALVSERTRTDVSGESATGTEDLETRQQDNLSDCSESERDGIPPLEMTSRNAVPTIAKFDLSSSDESSSSSDGDNDDESSSSSSEDSELSSKKRRRQMLGKRPPNNSRMRAKTEKDESKKKTTKRRSSAESENKSKTTKREPMSNRRKGLMRRPSQDDLDRFRGSFRRLSTDGALSNGKMRHSRRNKDVREAPRRATVDVAAESRRLSPKGVTTNSKSGRSPLCDGDTMMGSCQASIV